MGDRELFDEILAAGNRGIGVRLGEYPALDSYCRDIVGHYFQYCMAMSDFIKPPPRIFFSFWDCKFANGLALIYKDRCFVGLSKSLYFILFDLFNRMLSRNDLLMHIGDPTLEKNEEGLSKYYVNYDELLADESNSAKPQLSYPKDPVRASYAQHLTDIAIHFAFEHEISHIIYGHADYRDQFHHAVLTELVSEGRFKDIDSQAMEFDADCTAFSRYIGNRMYRSIRSNNSIPQDKYLFYESLHEAYFDALFAIGHLFWVFSEHTAKPPSNYRGTHPHPMMRLTYLSQLSLQVFDKLGIEHDKGQLLEMHKRFLVESDRCSLALRGTPLMKEAMKQIWERSMEDKSLDPKELKKHWDARLAPEVAPYSYRTLNRR